MELYVGGCAQGKLEYVRQLHKDEDLQIICGDQLGQELPVVEKGTRLVLNGFHLWVWRLLELGADPKKLAEELVGQQENCIIICDEVGNGIVPANEAQREYRECVGRITVQLAKRAEKVGRIVCGICQSLK